MGHDLLKLKPFLLDMEGYTECSFFTIGYYATARNNIPDRACDVTGEFGLVWLSELANVVHGCKFEYDRIGFDQAG